jgi:hypothetical protein
MHAGSPRTHLGPRWIRAVRGYTDLDSLSCLDIESRTADVVRRAETSKGRSGFPGGPSSCVTWLRQARGEPPGPVSDGTA